jgi:hypothetical protein
MRSTGMPMSPKTARPTHEAPILEGLAALGQFDEHLTLVTGIAPPPASASAFRPKSLLKPLPPDAPIYFPTP